MFEPAKSKCGVLCAGGEERQCMPGWCGGGGPSGVPCLDIACFARSCGLWGTICMASD